MARYITEIRNTGTCGDPYCNGHSDSYLVDTYSGAEMSLYPLPSSSILEAMNFMAATVFQRKDSLKDKDLTEAILNG